VSVIEFSLGLAVCVLIIQSVRAAGWKKIAKAAQKGNCEFRSTLMDRESTIEFYEKVHKQWAGFLKQHNINLMINGKIVQPLECERDTEWPEELN
jgi:hypothetical protein